MNNNILRSYNFDVSVCETDPTGKRFVHDVHMVVEGHSLYDSMKNLYIEMARRDAITFSIKNISVGKCMFPYVSEDYQRYISHLDDAWRRLVFHDQLGSNPDQSSAGSID